MLGNLKAKLKLAAARLWHNVNYQRFKKFQSSLIEESIKYLSQIQDKDETKTLYPLPLNTLIDVSFISDPGWKEIYRDLGYRGEKISHRKSWEYTQIIYGLEKLGKLHDKSEILGVAAGHERTLYYLANRCKSVTGTDLYEGSFAVDTGGALEADPSVLEEAEKYAPFEYRRENLKFMKMDALDLDFPDESFDAVTCVSSIEHFGGPENYKRAASEIARVLKPGGVAALTTEFSLNGSYYTGYFNRETLFKYVIEPSGLKLAEPFRFSINPDYYDHVRILPRDREKLPHLLIQLGKVLFTSISIFLMKKSI